LVKSEVEWSQIRLEIALDLLNLPKQTPLIKALVRGCADDPHVKRILAFYGVAV
jgi:hypothetical protein